MPVLHGDLRLENRELRHRADLVGGLELGETCLRVDHLRVNEIPRLQQPEDLVEGLSRVARQPLPRRVVVDASGVPLRQGLADGRECREAQSELDVDLGANVLEIGGEDHRRKLRGKSDQPFLGGDVVPPQPTGACSDGRKELLKRPISVPLLDLELLCHGAQAQVGRKGFLHRLVNRDALCRNPRWSKQCEYK